MGLPWPLLYYLSRISETLPLPVQTELYTPVSCGEGYITATPSIRTSVHACGLLVHMIYNPLQLPTRLSPLFLVHSVEPSIQENGDETGEGREAKEADPGSPRRCDIIIISGRKEKCEAAKEALEVRLPGPFCLEVSGPAQVAADSDSLASDLKMQTFALYLSWPLIQSREAVSFHQDSGFYSSFPDSSVRV